MQVDFLFKCIACRRRIRRIATNSETVIYNIFIKNICLDCSSGILISDHSDHFQILPNTHRFIIIIIIIIIITFLDKCPRVAKLI